MKKDTEIQYLVTTIKIKLPDKCRHLFYIRIHVFYIRIHVFSNMLMF